MTSGERLRLYIDNHHYKQKAIAEEMNMPPWKFNNILNGKRKLSADELKDFCDVVGITANDLLTYGD